MHIISSIRHPYWGPLGEAARTARTALQVSQAKIAQHVGLTVRQYAALESGFVPPDIASALGIMDLHALDEALDWDKGASWGYVSKAISSLTSPEHTTFHTALPDRSSYPPAAWARLGKAVRASRLAEGLSRNELAYAMKSSSKTIMRLEEGRIYGDPRTAPPGDYNSERYILGRLARMEFYLGWERDQALRILQGENRDTTSTAA